MPRPPLLPLVAALASAAPASAAPAGIVRPPDAPHMLVREADTGEVWFERGADLPRPIASVTKLMTAIALLEEDPDLERAVTLEPRHMLTPLGWTTPWQVGMTVTLRDLLGFALGASDNVAATALVEESGLPLEVFIARMNERAAEMGLRDTHFENVTGLDDRNVSTARDVAALVEAAAAYPEIRRACGLTEAVAELADGEGTVRSGVTDRLLFDPFWSVLAAKTGYTRLSGYCLAVVADAATGERVTMVFLGLDRDGKRFRMCDRVKERLRERDGRLRGVGGEGPDPAVGADSEAAAPGGAAGGGR